MDLLHLPMNEYVRGDLLDYSDTHAVVSRFGTAGLSATQSKFGGQSCYFDGAGSYLALPDSSAWDLSTFSIKTWFYITAFDTSGVMFAHQQSGGGVGGFELFANSNGSLYFGRNQSTTMVSAPAGSVTTGAWHHLAASWDGTTYRLFIDGNLVGSAASATAPDKVSGALRIGAYVGSSAYDLNGYLDDIHITTVPYTAAFTPPGAISYATPTLVTDILGGEIDHTPFDPPFATPQCQVLDGALSGARAMYIGGRGRVAGTVKKKPTIPLRRRVRLFRETDGLMVAETWSDAVTGAYSFDYVDPSVIYTVISYDHLHDYRAVAADNLTATLI